MPKKSYSECSVLYKKSRKRSLLYTLKSKKQIIFPKDLRTLDRIAENIKLARKRRKLTASQVAEMAGVVRTALYQIEKESPKVSLGAYFNVLKVL